MLNLSQSTQLPDRGPKPSLTKPSLDEGLAQLKEKVLFMAGFATLAVSRSVNALVQRDDEGAWRVTDDDDQIDRLELEIDQLAVRLLAHAPPAAEVRFITVAMRFCHELERVGDEATAISRRVLALNLEPPLQHSVDFSKMATLGLEMLQDSLHAFVNGEPDKARAIVARDKAVDAINKQLHRELTERISKEPAALGRCLDLMSIAKRLERVADHAKGLAEAVVYLYEACDIRHSARLLAETI
ncbi:MAG: phosphate signaling complex protein PhoU [Verrucomicrobiota bacterium]